MPKTTALVPFTHPDTGEPVAAGAEVTLSEESYNHLRQTGAVAASEQETREHTHDYDEKTGVGFKEGPGTGKGNYTARTSRGDVEGSAPPSPPPAPPKPPEKKSP